MAEQSLLPNRRKIGTSSNAIPGRGTGGFGQGVDTEDIVASRTDAMNEANLRAGPIDGPYGTYVGGPSKGKTPSQAAADVLYGSKTSNKDLYKNDPIAWLKANRSKKVGEQTQKADQERNPDPTKKRAESAANRRFAERGNRSGAGVKATIDGTERRGAYTTGADGTETLVGYSGKKRKITGPQSANVVNFSPSTPASPTPASPIPSQNPDEGSPTYPMRAQRMAQNNKAAPNQYEGAFNFDDPNVPQMGTPAMTRDKPKPAKQKRGNFMRFGLND